MARHMADDSHAFRAVITERRVYSDGREPWEYTGIYGPYRKASVCRGLITREKSDAALHNRLYAEYRGYTKEIEAKIQKSSTEWTDVED